jgi:hypothetical protein
MGTTYRNVLGARGRRGRHISAFLRRTLSLDCHRPATAPSTATCAGLLARCSFGHWRRHHPVLRVGVVVIQPLLVSFAVAGGGIMIVLVVAVAVAVTSPAATVAAPLDTEGLALVGAGGCPVHGCGLGGLVRVCWLWGLATHGPPYTLSAISSFLRTLCSVTRTPLPRCRTRYAGRGCCLSGTHIDVCYSMYCA